MFERAKYKKQAKVQLKKRSNTAVLATFITLIIFILISSTPSDAKKTSVTAGTVKNVDYRYDLPSQGFKYEFKVNNVPSHNFLFNLLSISITGIVTLALCHLFNEYTKTTDPVSFEEYLRGFNLWLKGALAALWYFLWVCLWSFLFIIPGIVKAFSYSQMFFILAENPEIGVTKAMRISKAITKGYKGDLFVMCLSFIGWELLSVFTIGILQLWLIPYQMLSFTNAYKDIKYQAIRTGVISMEDFN